MRRRWSRAACAVLLLVTGACASALDRAQAAHGRGEYDEAESLYRKAVDDERLTEAAEDGLADLYADRARERESEDPEQAEAHYREALSLRPTHDAALTGLVRLLRKAGRLEDASRVIDEAEASGQCGGSCGRLALVVLLERGDVAFAAQRWDEALAAYTEAQNVREQPAGAVAIAATHLGAGRLADAEAALGGAQPLMRDADASTVDRFVQVRRAMLERALADGDIEAADRVRAVRIGADPPSRQIELALVVADALHQGPDQSAALPRYEELLQHGGESALDDTQRAAIAKKAALIHAALGTADLHDGRAKEADARFSKAIELQPDDWSLKLQRILALSSTTGAEPALASLSQVPSNAAGLIHVRAILLALRVREQIATGDVEAARLTLEEAQQAHADLPEVHLAAATVLAFSPSDELSGGARRALLGKTSVVSYRGEVFRFGEALAELDWVRGAVEERSKAYPFTAPWLSTEVAQLRGKLQSVYPLPVSFREEPEPVVVLQNSGDRVVDIAMNGPEGLGERFVVAPKGERAVTVPDSGVVRLQLGRKKKIFYAEGYCRVIIDVALVP